MKLSGVRSGWLRLAGVLLFVLLAVSTSSPALAELQPPVWVGDGLAEDCAQTPSCKNDCVCEGRTVASVLAYYEGYKGEREKMTDVCALSCWYQYKGMGIGNKEVIESCIPYNNRACDRCKNAAKAVTNTPTATSRPRSTATITPKASPTPTRVTATLTATPAFPASISGRLTTTYTLPGKPGIRTAPLPHAMVIVSLGNKQMVSYADENGRYQIPDVSQQLRGINPGNAAGGGATSGGVVIQVDLRSMNPAKLTIPNFEIFYQNQTKPISLKTTCPVALGGAPMTCDVDLAKTTFQDTGGVPKDRLVPIGLIYAFADRADAMQKKLENSFSMLPVAVRVFYQNDDDKQAWWQAANAPGGGLVGSIYISEKKFRAISSYAPLSSTVPHEFGHQFMADRYSDRLPDNPADKSHAGFCYNSSSTDAWVEGFASFFASMVRKNYLNIEKYWILPNGNKHINLETNFTALDYEEIAVAGILFDLVDQASDYSSNADDDGIHLTLEELWKVLVMPVNFHTIRDMVDLYEGLKAAGVGQADADKDGLTALDDVFIAHGFYESLDDDPAYNPGEKIGYTSHKQLPECKGKTSNYMLGAVRRSPPELPGSFIQFNLQDQAGQAIQDGIITVRIEYDPPHQSHSFTYELSTQELDDNRLYLILPPPDYPSRALIQVKSDGYQGFQTVVVSGQQFWEHVRRQEDTPIQRAQISLIAMPFLVGGGGLALCCGGGVLTALAVGLVLVLRRRGGGAG